MSLYGFKREKNSFKKPVFSHIFFRKGRRDLLSKIGRARQSGMKSKVVVNSMLIESCVIQIKEISADLQVNGFDRLKMVLFEHIKTLDLYVGRGIIKFMKNLLQLLNKAFSEVERELSNEINKTRKIMLEDDFIKSSDMVNKKEILITLINSILTEIDKELFKTKQSLTEKVSVGNSSVLNGIRSSFISICYDNIALDKRSPFVEAQMPLLMSPTIEYPVIYKNSDELNPKPSSETEKLPDKDSTVE